MIILTKNKLQVYEKDGIVNRTVDKKSGIISYTLTQKGADLQPVFEQVHNWADKWA